MHPELARKSGSVAGAIVRSALPTWPERVEDVVLLSGGTQMARPRVRRLFESARDERASTQVAALLRRILETTREKAVVVCEMVGVLRILKDWARSAFGASVVAMIDGKVGKADRARRLRSLNAADSDLRVLFLSKRCTEGITCVGANHLIELGPSWNPVTDVQALGRIQRFGQTRPCHVVRVVICGSIEELILLRQADKSGLVELVNGGKLPPYIRS